jgi:hypothetical protein
VEELDQYVDDEFHRRVVVVVKDDVILAWAQGLLALFDGELSI